MTQLEYAKKGLYSEGMKIVAQNESISLNTIRRDIAKGHTVILKSQKHDCRYVGIGKGLKIKVNANIGTSNISSSLKGELKKLKAAVQYGTDTVMDLSTGGNIDDIRKRIIEESQVPIGTVPIYQTIVKKPEVGKIKEEDFLHSIFSHIESGVDFITVHCGVTRNSLRYLDKRIMGIVSRGGSFIAKWMLYHNRENPLYVFYDEILAAAKKYDVVLSLGDGLRPGCLADATDRAQITELKTLGILAKRARKAGVQVMIEGPGHVPLDQIKENILLQKKYCHSAPFYVLGPLVTDISPGYDHISGAIGGALAAYYGADFLCYLTPTEHLGLPRIDHVVDGVIASKIAAHAADIARGIRGSRNMDDEMSRARCKLDWKKMYSLALNPEKAKAIREVSTADMDACTMCGDFCSAKINREICGIYKSKKTG
jgi:phosphomethylpyrimidine synthase